ncbi:hypothetical protein FEM48_Zijuj03G0042900 [Ziziphus jujuba var. spinosa]|uniref:GDSL esterase/lipase At5g03610-like n=1 Tax=Ziziphus jujuba var. spinosa TaxID=714518 RepID=A0A978VN49_ZIZJJ|nr:hypothetical protein FEM48_Zijuj03G0042900 [Ziziphus jujuba var. spinosa]
MEKWEVANGMNFAYGGTGVFNTLEKPPNMSTQISFFQQLRQQKWYTKQELNPSIALLSLAGNDYGTSVVNHGNNPKDMSDLSKLVVNQLADNIKPILSLGKKNVIVVLDLYTAFQSAFAKQKNITVMDMDVGVLIKVGKEVQRMQEWELPFFWDMIHPSQKGWHAVYSELQPSLYKLF